MPGMADRSMILARPPAGSHPSAPRSGLIEALRYDEYTYLRATIMATSIRLDPATEQRLDRLAAQTGRTKAYYLRELVAKGLEGLED